MSVIVPARFSKNVTAAGAFRQFDKVLGYGPGKVGKSRLGGGFPGPIAAIDSGEGGIEVYLNKDRGDLALMITDPAATADAFEWLCEEARKGSFATIILDSGTLFWENVKDAGYEQLGGKQAQYQDWNWIKKSSNKVLKAAMAVPANVYITAWEQNLVAEQEDQKGMAPKMKIRKVERARIEGKFPYLFDYIFSLDQEEDTLGRQTGNFIITFIGGRIPPSVPTGELRPGREWKYSPQQPKTPQQVYEEVIGWLRPYKEQGGVPLLAGLDEEKVQKSWEELRDSVNNEVLGLVVKTLMKVTTPAEFHQSTITLGPLVIKADAEIKPQVQELVNRKKRELGLS